MFTKEGKKIYHRRVWSDARMEGQPLAPKVDLAKASPWFAQQIRLGNVINLGPALVNLPEESGNLRELMKLENMNSGIFVPMHLDDGSIVALGFDSIDRPVDVPESLANRLKTIVNAFGLMIRRVEYQKAQQSSLEEIRKLKDLLEQQNKYLREELDLKHAHETIIGKSESVTRMLRRVEEVAETDSTVLILGETGTGKELIANEIHRLSRRKQHPLIKVNCAALPATLIESELFGREKGAFTGSLSRQIGRFEIADGSTLFLDEIGEMPVELQAKLLRVLEDGTFERLGSPKSVSVDVRIIASTNRDLASAMSEGRFREDLYYRLNVFPVNVSPLRDRIEDIPILVWGFVKEFEESMGRTIHNIPQQSLDRLQHYSWPGNVRELKNLVEHAMIVSKDNTLRIDLPDHSTEVNSKALRLEDLERNHIEEVLKQTSWKVSGKNGAAELLGLKPTTLESRMKKLEITRPGKRPPNR